MKDFFRHQLKSYSRAMIVITVIMLMMGFFIYREDMERKQTSYYSEEYGRYVFEHYQDYSGKYWNEKPNYGFYDDNGDFVKVSKVTEITYHKMNLDYPFVMLMILSIGVPVWMFAFLKKKRNLDCFYSLSITRRQIGVVQYLVGLIATLLPFTLTYLLAIGMHAAYSVGESVKYGYILAHFSLCLLAGIIVYSFSVFAFNEANSAFDGVVMIVAYTLLFITLVSTFETVWNEIAYASMPQTPNVQEMEEYYVTLNRRCIYISYECGIHFVYFGEFLGDYETTAIRPYFDSVSANWKDLEAIIWLIVWIAVGIGSAVLAYFRLDKRKAEYAEEQSSGVLAYKTLIPIYAFALTVAAFCEYVITEPMIMITVGTAVAYTVYRRGVRYKKSDYIIVGILFALTVISLFFGGGY